MQIKLSYDFSKPVTGEASTIIETSPKNVFEFIADNFFENYPKWAPEVIELTSLDGDKVGVGVKGKQVRQDNDSIMESNFEIVKYDPYNTFAFQGVSPPYKNTYLTEAHINDRQTKLTFRFDLLEIDIFMRPFVKLIRVAIEDGAEATVDKIKALLVSKHAEVV